MAIGVAEGKVHTLEYVREEEIAASMDVVFETLLEEMGPNNSGLTQAMPMVLEPWPGGRWFRDLGNGDGHWWGTVQSIKRPSLLEICGPLFMSYPSMSNVQYRLSEEGGVTRLRLVHKAMAYIAFDPQIASQWKNFEAGWGSQIDRVLRSIEKKHKK